VSSGPQLVDPSAPSERNWLPLAVAAVIVLAAIGGMILYYEHAKSAPAVTPISAPPDPYAGNLVIGNLAMSESSNLSGGKVTYLDGHITNKGTRTVTGITVQVLFRDAAHEVAQNETQPLKVIRTRDPYVDLEPLSAAPLKPGEAEDFRLVFDTIPDQWDGAYPDVRIIHVDAK
jgi:hypothetical protein